MAVKCLITLIYVQIQTRLACQAHKWVPCPISPNAQENAQHTWHPGDCQVLFLFLQFPGFWQSSFTWQFHNPPFSSLKLLGGKMRPIILPSVKAYSCPNLVKTLLCASSFPVFERDLGGWTATTQKCHLCRFPCFSALVSPEITFSWNSFSPVDSSILVSKWIHSEHQMAPSQWILYKNCSTKIY